MKLKGLLKKTGAIFMASAMLCTGAAAVLPIAAESGIEVSAAAYGDYEYKVLGNGTVEITHYNGSASSLSIPGSINGKKVTSIGESAFWSCESLTSVTIPSSVTSIGELAFADCASLTSIKIPSGVKSIGAYAFSCTSLKSVTIPSSVKSIGEYAFNGCKGLADKNGFVIVKSILFDYFGNSANVIIPSGVTSIGKYAFEHCTSLKSVTIPSSVTSIGIGAFDNCTSLKSVTIPSSVKSIGTDAFYNCTSLKSVTIPSSVKSIGEGAFYGCKGLADKNGFVILNGVLFDYFGNSANVIIPSGVTSIGKYAFEHCTSLKSVTIPSGVKSIGEYAFYNCTSLESVTIPSSVTSIGNGAFEHCESLKSVTIPSGVTSIGNGAFEFCESLTSVTIPSGVTSIGKEAFYNCTSLESVTIPSGVTSIGAEAFSFCRNLTSITIPSSVTNIGIMSFCECIKLKSVTLQSGLKSIGENAFYNCTSLKSVTIPSSVTSIGVGAFNECTSLKSVTIPSSVKSIGKNAFGYYLNSAIESEKVAGFTVYGTKDSSAEKYAKDNGFKFVELPAPGSLSLNKTSMSLGMGESIKLTANVLPDKTPDKIVSWRTSSSKILTVDQNGNVKAVGTGIAWITARTTNGKEKSCKITVKNAPSKVTLTKGILTIGVGEKYSVNSGVNNGAAAAKRTYRTSNSSIVKMTRTDWQGEFVGVKPGVAYVTVRTYNGKESTCKVTVKAAPTSVTISKKNMTMKVGQTATLNCSVPSNAGCATRTFRSSNNNIVKMTKTNWTGSFKAVARGTAYVTVRTYNGKESSCKITVVK